jgi:predicted membrane protein
VDLELNIGAGELNVYGGAKNWVDGTITYNYDRFKPEISYKLKGNTGNGVIEQKKSKGFHKVKKLENKWELNLNDTIPINLNVNSGASKTTLNLNGLKLNSLNVNTGVGELTVDLSGNWKKSFDTTLKMGVGKSTIILPSDVGVKINSSKGIGKTKFDGFISKGNGIYVNEAYKDAAIIINVNTELGVGETIFKLK